jgi:subtilisin family serine protease
VTARRAAVLLSLLALVAACAGHRTIPSQPAAPTSSPPGPPPSVGPTDYPDDTPLPTRPPRTPRPTFAAGSLTIDSNPQGLPVTINGVAQGVTPIVQLPLLGVNAPVYSIGDEYSIAYQSNGTQPQTIYYNSRADDRGRLQSISTSAVGARPERPFSIARVDPLQRASAGAYDDATLYVTYAPSVRAAQAERTARGAGALHSVPLLTLSSGDTMRVVNAGKGNAAALAARLRGMPGVVAVQRVARLHVLDVTPNDPFYAYQWDMPTIGMPSAWSISLGSPSVEVAVIDTGYDTHHPDLASNIAYAESDIQGITTVGSAAAQDYVGHGTNVSGIVAADTDNGFGYAGVGYNVKLQEYCVSNNFDLLASDVALAVTHAVANGARVINLSIGGSPGFVDPGQYAAIQAAIARGVVVVAAAGNAGSSQVDEPAVDPGVIAVGASALDDGGSGDPLHATEYVAAYSNYGARMALVAPGGSYTSADDPDYLHHINNLWSSTVNGTRCSIIDDDACGFIGISGTSMASPHVAGAAALMLSVNPALSPANVAAILRATADDIHDSKQGAGRLDVYRALASAAGLPPPARPQSRNFTAIAYAVDPGSNVPIVLDKTYPHGVQVESDGTFRIVDVPADAPAFEIGLWYDQNGDGSVDAGDYFGSAGPCTASAVCEGLDITVHPIAAGFQLR